MQDSIAVLELAFTTLDINRVQAYCFSNNPASARLLEKAGMSREGVMRQNVCKWGEFCDAIHYAIVRIGYDHC